MNRNEFDLIADMLSQAKDSAEYPAQQRFLRDVVSNFVAVFRNIFPDFNQGQFMHRVGMPEDFGQLLGRRLRPPIPPPSAVSPNPPIGSAEMRARQRLAQDMVSPYTLNASILPGAPTPSGHVPPVPQMAGQGIYEELAAQTMHIVARPRPAQVMRRSMIEADGVFGGWRTAHEPPQPTEIGIDETEEPTEEPHN